ncbi:CDP-glycerol glycerophosphotransferase (TagB/SpsB family) [Leucobacter luti]|uniref:CDP-glycerol glycerophosphotransferase (TagB/SpsB family) n=1 Tax=Leucobacter luti TaxID=340320 RepID=A0A4Q7TTV1_9MICO|nr:CDP-glycerol glycerophosphotransferase (TagB/SpsB family) [Leucobacter luti]
MISILGRGDQSWRIWFFLLRSSQKRSAPRAVVASLEQRVRAAAFTQPQAIPAYLNYVTRQSGYEQAVSLARELELRADASAAELVELAKFHFEHNRLALGDALIERAKDLSPDLPRIYDEEAWNQRARGNVHREIAALRRCIDLAATAQARLEWEMWLGEAYLRLRDPHSAWPHLANFDTLPQGTPSLLSAGYCATLLGKPEAAVRAYRQFAPKGDDYDALTCATQQLTGFSRARETLRIITERGLADTTPGLELTARAALAVGDADSAATALAAAVVRDDRSAWTRGVHAQLLHARGDERSALAAYELLEEEDGTPLLGALRSSLYAAQGSPQLAVQSFITQYRLGASWADAVDELSVDPRARSVFARARRERDSARRATLLSDLLGRLSSERSITTVARLLAQDLAELGNWEAAWDALRFSFAQRLPAVPLTPEVSSPIRLTSHMTYAEWTETEPIARGVVLYESSLGDAVSCNPLAMCLELLRDPNRTGFSHVWSITENARIPAELADRPDVRFVRKGSPGHLRALATSEYLINNSTWDYVFTKRPGQRALNTWHGVPWKKLGRNQRNEPFSYGNVARSLLQADLVIAPDHHTLDVLSEGMDIGQLSDPERFVRTGHPRNDLAVNLAPATRHAIRESLGVTGDTKLVLFMPTWRGLMGKRDAEVEETRRVAQGLVSEGVVVALRAHHYVRQAFVAVPPQAGVRLVSEEFDTNQLLGAADALVTDFSSVLFDAAAVGVPVVTLVTDIASYEDERGLYFTPEEVPGCPADTLEEARALLSDALREPESYRARYAPATERFSWPESGDSAARALSLLLDPPAPGVGGGTAPAAHPRAHRLYLGASGLPTNGITRALRSLVTALADTDVTPYLSVTVNSLETAADETIADIREFAKILPHVGAQPGTRMEQETAQYFKTLDYERTEFTDRFLASGRRRESRRVFADREFDSALEFSAYDPMSVAFTAAGIEVRPGGQRGVMLHNEMMQEVETRYPRLRSSLAQLAKFDFIASVSESVREANAAALARELAVPEALHITLENIILPDTIRTLGAAPLGSEDRSWYGRPGVHFCVASRLSPEKNHFELLDALARSESKDQLFLTLLGDGPLAHELRVRIGELGLQDRVRMRGLVENPYPHIRACDAMMLPSRYEGQGLVLLEALTLGVPVVATDIPGPRSVLNDGQFGLLVPCTQRGIMTGLDAIAAGDLVTASDFSAEEYAADALRAFLRAIGAGSATPTPTEAGQ